MNGEVSDERPLVVGIGGTIGSVSSTERALRIALDAAERGAQATADMLPRKGRSSYLGERALGHPDPGAEAVAVLLRALADRFGGGA